jgi:hypothetical protein
MHSGRTIAFTLLASLAMAFCPLRAAAQAALLLEEPYGFYGTLNPTGHSAIYFDRICAETPIRLRRCAPGELGAVISRYQGIGGFDWVAIPLIPYLYSVENASEVPNHVDRETVTQMRVRYHEAHLLVLGDDVPQGNFTHGGWGQLVGVAYERRTYAFRFNTTPEQDDTFIDEMNAGLNHSHFDMFFRNCADFARVALNTYFPRAFRRGVFPDAGVTTPKQIAYKLVRYARKRPEMQLAVFEIPQVSGYRHSSHFNKSIDESLATTVYVVPIALINPYLAGGLFVDYLIRGRYHLVPRNPEILTPDNLASLTASASTAQNADSAGIPVVGGAAKVTLETPASDPANSSLQETKVPHE